MSMKIRTAFLAVIFTMVFALDWSVYSAEEVTAGALLPDPVIQTVEPMFSRASASSFSSCEEQGPISVEEAYSLTEAEIDLIALVTMGEAEGEPELGKRYVIDTILNRVDDCHFPDTVYDVIYQPNQFSVIWNGRLERCFVDPEIVELVKEELLERTNDRCVFFRAEHYSQYGKPMFQECCHYFSSYD